MRRDSAAVEAVADYVDALIGGRQAEAIAPDLAQVVHLLRADLRRRDPPSPYVDHLRLRLIAAADQRPGVGIVVSLPAWRQPRFIIGAAGLVSAAAVLAYVTRSRWQAKAAA